MIQRARKRTSPADGDIDYRVLDANDEERMAALGRERFDSALSNMALFDMAEIEPLFRVLFTLLKSGGCFVFSMMHPCFNQALRHALCRDRRTRRRFDNDFRRAGERLYDANDAPGTGRCSGSQRRNPTFTARFIFC